MNATSLITTNAVKRRCTTAQVGYTDLLQHLSTTFAQHCLKCKCIDDQLCAHAPCNAAKMSMLMLNISQVGIQC